MLSLQCGIWLFKNKKQPSSIPVPVPVPHYSSCFSFCDNKTRTLSIIPMRLDGTDHVFKKTIKTQPYPRRAFIVHADAVEKEKDTQQYEIDSDKAKEALQQLDQQLQAFSDKKISSPKMRASDVKLTRDETTEEVPEVPGSVLAYTAIALLLFTFFYNIFFLTVIKPSVDGPLPEPESSPPITATTMEREPTKGSILQLLPLMPDVFMQSYGSGGYN